MDMAMIMTTSTASMVMSMATESAKLSTASPTASAMSMGGSTGCKLSMLLNWTTIDACFLFPSFHIRSSFTFFLACLGSFLLVIALEFLRRFQREFDRYLRARKLVRQGKKYVLPEEMEEKLLDKGTGVGSSTTIGAKERPVVVVLEQFLRGLIHMLQFSIGYCIMLLFMYSNGYIITSIILGALVGFALFTRDTLYSPNNDIDDIEKACC